MTLDKLLQKLSLRHGRWGGWKLARMEQLLASGGMTVHGPFLHIGGTAGKGSVCAIVERGLREVGLRTGLYTSPHLVEWQERIRIDGKAIGTDELAALLERWIGRAEQLAADDLEKSATGFEILTAAALDHFLAKKVDVAILEVGLGGRIDATNVVQPDLCAITTVGMDHLDVLGESLEEIAAEKAGILKPGIPAVLGPMPRRAEAVVRERARMVAAPILPIPSWELPQPCHLHGVEQARNFPLAAAIAWHWLRIHGKLGEKNWKKCQAGMAQARWPGRWDVRTVAGRRWIFDATLNSCGLPYLRRNWKNFCTGQTLWPSIIAGSLSLRRAETLLPFLLSIAGEMTLVALDEERSLGKEDWTVLLPNDLPLPVGIVSERDLPLLRPQGDPILVTGSIHLTGKMLAVLAEEHAEFVPVGDL
ncbi:MAG: hypothetical protein LBP65_02860 [Puniceicoccales bacterium]|jgi:dihydrofolate synthase/folylpolyglutamate synthase|nr:hypothetical protein [Puniceicoccales bacterium]